MQDPLAVGVVGVGNWGTRLGHEVNAAGDAAVDAVADVSEENRTAAGEELGVPPEARYGSHEGMLADSALDAVVVTTPHALHYEQVCDALDRGCHVYCEKPLTPDVEQARDLARRAERGDRVLMVGYQRHLHPAYVAAREEVERMASPPEFVTAEITQDWIEPYGDTWRGDPDLSGGGQLYDTGNHLVDAVLWLTGLTPRTVSAEMTFDDAARRVDTQATLNVDFEEGAVASIGVSGDSPRVRENIHVWGERGVTVEGEGWVRRETTVVDADGTEHTPHLDGFDANRAKVEAFVRAIREGETPPATARDALAAVALTEAAYDSARTGERVDVDL